jgi:hypothetical protein
MLRLDDLQADVARLEKQIAEARGGRSAARARPPGEVPAETTQTPGAV